MLWSAVALGYVLATDLLVRLASRLLLSFNFFAMSQQILDC
jgi:hypothetical protein